MIVDYSKCGRVFDEHGLMVDDGGTTVDDGGDEDETD